MKWYLLLLVFNLHGVAKPGIESFGSGHDRKQAEQYMDEIETVYRYDPDLLAFLMGVSPARLVKNPHHVAMCVPFVELGGGLK